MMRMKESIDIHCYPREIVGEIAHSNKWEAFGVWDVCSANEAVFLSWISYLSVLAYLGRILATMHTVLYIIWFLIPASFFILALFARLEQMGGSVRKQNPVDFLRQGFFVLIAVLVAVAIDRYILPGFVAAWAPDYLPLGLFQILLLPAVLLGASYLIGPSKSILVGSENTKASKSRKKR